MLHTPYPETMSRLVTTLAGLGPVRAAVNAGFHSYARRRVAQVAALDPAEVQRRTLLHLVRKARDTRFGRDHQFPNIRTVEDYRRAVPLRTYEDLWLDYLKDQYPVFDNLTWPGRVPYLALTSGTTTANTKYIPITREMLASNQKAAQSMVAFDLAANPRSRLFRGKLFMLGGSTDLKQPGPGVEEGDLSGVTAKNVKPWLLPYAFPPLDLALDPVWDRKLATLAERSLREPVTLVSGVSSCLLSLFQKLLDLTGKSTVPEVWPKLEVVVHGGVKFDPYREAFATYLGRDRVRLQESYPCSEGFVAFGDPATGLLRLMLDHGIYYEFVPAEELDSENPTRHWLGNIETGVNYAIVVSTCAGMWSHIIGDTVRFESLSPPLLTFTGRTKYALSAFGEHLVNEEVEAAMAAAGAATGATIRDWHLGPAFHPPLGHHDFVVEFLRPPADSTAFRDALDDALCAANADYRWYRRVGARLPAPALVVAGPGGFEGWMRSRGKLGGQHKVPRMDATGALTGELMNYLDVSGSTHMKITMGMSSAAV